MNKKVKILIFVGIVAIVLFAIWYKKRMQKVELPTAPSLPNIAPAPPQTNDNFPLNIGSRGERVKTLQMALNKINEKQTFLGPAGKITPLVVDGIYGEKTKNAINVLCGFMYLSQSGLTEQNFNSIIQKSNQ